MINDTQNGSCLLGFEMWVCMSLKGTVQELSYNLWLFWWIQHAYHKLNSPSQLSLATNLVFLCSPNSTKQNLLEELDGIQSDLTALKLKNEELKVNQQECSQEVYSILFYLLDNRVINFYRKKGPRCLEYDQSLNTEDRVLYLQHAKYNSALRLPC